MALQEFVTAEQLIVAARGLVGVPYLRQGRTRTGVDGIGLLVLACQEAGVNLSDFIGDSLILRYGRNPNPQTLSLLAIHCSRIDKAVPGCVFCFRSAGDKVANHLGIFTGDAVIHAEAWRKQVIEHSYRDQWLKWIHSMWLVPGVDYSGPPDSTERGVA